MEQLANIFELILHMDEQLKLIIQDFGIYTYLILFCIIFCETGLVVTPFLPGDSLLFIAGTLAAGGLLQIDLLYILVFLAAVIGDTVNYHVGAYIGPKVFKAPGFKLINREHLHKTQRFYNKHGMQIIILARFIPIIRTFAPFVAGIGKMRYKYFIIYNVIGAFLWTTLLLLGGYFFGNIPLVQKNYTLVIALITLISMLPGIIGFLKSRMQKKQD